MQGRERTIATQSDTRTPDHKNWVWVILCAAAIFSTIPVARRFQGLIYSSIGKEFFTYLVIASVCIALAVLLYLFIFTLKVTRISQYAWLVACAGMYFSLVLHLDEHPEEAVHILEYGLLSLLIFRALSQHIQDSTVYLSAGLLTLVIGFTDEFLQWLIPQRYWSFKDVGLNGLSGGISLIALCKGIRPAAISRPVSKTSVRIVTVMTVTTLVISGLCLSNTPLAVNRYTGYLGALSWLQREEPMAEYGYKYNDPQIGTIYVRSAMERLRKADLERGAYLGGLISKEIGPELTGDKIRTMMTEYNPGTDPFLYDFLVHLLGRNESLKDRAEAFTMYEKIKLGNTAFRENLILEKYFGATLQHSGLVWSSDTTNELRKASEGWKEEYVSGAGSDIITSFSLKTAQIVIATLVTIVLLSGRIWGKRPDKRKN